MNRVIKSLGISILMIMMNGSNIAYADINSFSNLKDVEENIYSHLKNRDTVISFSYSGDKNDFKQNITKAIEIAYKKDDYTERSWLEINPKAEVQGNKIETSIKVNYLTTKEQEIFVDSEIKKVIEQIIKPNMTDLEKVKTINDYIMARYDYDYTFKSNNAYLALTTGKTICQGYSMTAYKMLTYSGIQNRIIVGSVDGTSHSWNYVKINNSWKYLDITNNDSTRSDKYFLVDENVLLINKYVWNKNEYTI